MCGIAGVLQFDAQRRVDPVVLDRMTDVLAHRGPDGRGTHIDGALGLGHRRLAIIDLSPAARQPMANEDETVWVVCNGEIYNHVDLRAELEAKGHRFRSHSDSEVLVHLYEDEGPELVHRLRGMFAFALWDAPRRRLLLARDRFGQKPLYYRLTDDGLWFASEIKGIIADPEVPRVLDPLALHGFLSFSYVPSPRTAFAGIRKLPAAHRLVITAEGHSRLSRFWQLPLHPKPNGRRSTRSEERALTEELCERIDEAVRLRLMSDVPLGAFLSGGVDSSAIVAAMVARGSGAVRTFSIGFQEPEYDERRYARRVAERLGTQHTELVLEPDDIASVDRLAWYYGEPFADASAFPTFAVSELTRGQVTVALSGDGGDELFLGYDRYRGAYLAEKQRLVPDVLRRLGLQPFVYGTWLKATHSRLPEHLLNNHWGRDLSLEDLYLRSLQYLFPELKAELYAPGLLDAVREVDALDGHRQLLRTSRGASWPERCGDMDSRTYLPDNILVKVDVASMAFGLECRSPFLDHELAEFVGRLPANLKQRRLTSKRCLKRAVAQRLPAEILDRRKMGFGAPLEHWFRGKLDRLLEDRLLSPEARGRGLFRPETVERLVREHVRGAANHRNILFPLLMLESWQRQFMGAEVPLTAPA